MDQEEHKIWEVELRVSHFNENPISEDKMSRVFGEILELYERNGISVDGDYKGVDE